MCLQIYFHISRHKPMCAALKLWIDPEKNKSSDSKYKGDPKEGCTAWSGAAVWVSLAEVLLLWVVVMTETCFPLWTECLEIAFVHHANSTQNWSLSLTENFIRWWEQSLPYSFHSETSPGTQTCSGQGGRELCFKELGRGQRWQTAQPMGRSDGKPPGQQVLALCSLCGLAWVALLTFAKC